MVVFATGFCHCGFQSASALELLLVGFGLLAGLLCYSSIRNGLLVGLKVVRIKDSQTNQFLSWGQVKDFDRFGLLCLLVCIVACGASEGCRGAWLAVRVFRVGRDLSVAGVGLLDCGFWV